MIPGSDPNWNDSLHRVATARRIVREPDKVFFLWVPVVYSDIDGKYHRVLPEFLAKFKHYTITTIVNAVNGNDDLDQYSFPSDSTINRWKNIVHERKHRTDDARIIPGSLPKTDIHDNESHTFTYEEIVFLLKPFPFKRL